MQLKKADTALSIFIRRRDANEYDYCTCPLCGWYGHWKTFVNGHVIPRDIKSTRWHPDNCHAISPNCNIEMENDEALKQRYKLWVIEKIGPDRWSELMAIRLAGIPWNQRMIDEIARKYSNQY